MIVFDLNYYLALPLTMIVKKDLLDDVVGELLKYVPLRHEFSLLRWISHWLHY